MDDIRDRTLTRPDGRTVAWTEYGSGGRTLLRMPGTPGSRWSIRADRDVWDDRDLRVLTTERPGYGASTPLPGRGFAQPSDDLAAVLDEAGVERAYVIGGSGGAPHVLSFCERHPDRVLAATVLVGIAPVDDAEIDSMIGLNQSSWRFCRAGDRAGEEGLLEPVRQAMLADPIAAFRGIMHTAPPDDQRVMTDPGWQAAMTRGTVEALQATLDGWVDEAFAMSTPWVDIDPSAIATSITWYHAAGDRNCPLPAARRLVDRIPSARLVEWPSEVGHLYGYRHEGEILDELLARG